MFTPRLIVQERSHGRKKTKQINDIFLIYKQNLSLSMFIDQTKVCLASDTWSTLGYISPSHCRVLGGGGWWMHFSGWVFTKQCLGLMGGPRNWGWLERCLQLCSWDMIEVCLEAWVVSVTGRRRRHSSRGASAKPHAPGCFILSQLARWPAHQSKETVQIMYSLLGYSGILTVLCIDVLRGVSGEWMEGDVWGLYYSIV